MLKILIDLFKDLLMQKYEPKLNEIKLRGIETSIADLKNLKELPVNLSSSRRINSFNERIANLKQQKKELLRNM